MVSNTNQEMRKVADEFARWVTFQYHDFKEFQTLFSGPEKRHELLEKTAINFFEDLFWMYIERIILNVSKLTDRRKKTLSIINVHNFFSNITAYNANEAEMLINDIQDKAKKVQPWRNNVAAHNKWSVAIDIEDIKDKFEPKDIEDLYISLEKYVDLLFSSVFKEVMPIDMVSPHGVDELIGALKEAHALRVLRKRDINAYANLMSNCPFKDA